MSLGAAAGYVALDTAVRNSIASGVTYVFAAGNNYGANACSFSPGRVWEGITVGATNNSDTRSSFSNIGTCVDLFAPGENITSDYKSLTTATLSGTSMAAPHVTGAAALYLERNPGASPSTVGMAIIDNAPTQKVLNAGSGSPTRLLYSNPTPSCGQLSSGQALAPGQTLWSCAGNARIVHQNDGNVVVYDRLGALWSTNTAPWTTSTFVMQTDGNLALYLGEYTGALWNSGTGGWGPNAGAYMLMQNDCNLVVYSAAGTPLWASYTTCR